MADMTTYMKNAVANVLRNTAFGAITTVYAALFTSATGDDGSGTEVSGAGYARQAVTLDAPTDGVTANSNDVTFGPAGESWGTVTHMGLYDAETGGHMLMHDALAASKTIGSGDEAVFSAGEIDLTFS